jgi:prepilin-type N-terminal cleavage/methylation domain-containing protein
MNFHRVRRLTAAPKRAVKQQAYTIIELLAVVVLIGLTATIAMPSVTPGESKRLDLVAAETANAMRFARSEAMRTGEAKGFIVNDPLRIRVFSIDIDASPLTREYNVYHPVDKNIYTRIFAQQPFAFGGDVSRNMDYRGTCSVKRAVYFDADGIPWCSDPVDVLLEQFVVTLTQGADSRVVTLNGITGRVTIQ